MSHAKLGILAHTAPLHTAFTISRGSKMCAETVRVTLSADGATGRGECVPYARYGETVAGVVAAIEATRTGIEAAGDDVAALSRLGLAGAALCAVDCAGWDLGAKRSGVPVTERLGLGVLLPLETAVTVALDAPRRMAEAARTAKSRLLKLKLGGEDGLERVAAVHAARPDARLILDGNEAIPAGDLDAIAAEAARLGVVLIEQPLAAGADTALRRGRYAVPVCADESAHTASDIPALAERYDAVNIKLDKAGGLTGALKMLEAAQAADMQVMVGCMVAGSLSMAPAAILAQRADFVDLDGPLWLAEDVAGGLSYEGGKVFPPSRSLWG